jgi:DNA sulfur modification protein DndE
MRSFIMGIFVIPALFAVPVLRAEEQLSVAEAEAIAVDAYIYGYPLVTMDMTRRVLTNTACPSGGRAPMGQFANARAYPDASFRAVTAPNADTLYSTAWLDLSREPYILFLPDERDRYYVMPMLSGWTDVFASLGSRTEGTGAGMYAITGPSWSGVLPEGVKEIKAPTNMVWIIGRTYCDGTPRDYICVHALQDQYRLVPLSAFGKPYTPPKANFDPTCDMTTPVRLQVSRLDAITFFTRLAALMKENTPSPEDAPLLARMAKIGIIPGQRFATETLRPKIISALMRAPRLARAKLVLFEKSVGKMVNGWQFLLDLGKYGTNYPLRALTAAIGLGANLPADAIYPMAKVDADGNRLIGTNSCGRAAARSRVLVADYV